MKPFQPIAVFLAVTFGSLGLLFAAEPPSPSETTPEPPEQAPPWELTVPLPYPEPKEAPAPPRQPLAVKPEAVAPNFWRGTTWMFYQAYPIIGGKIVYAAYLVINSNLNFNLTMRAEETYESGTRTNCERIGENHNHGTVGVYNGWLDFPGKPGGVSYLVDTCNQAVNGHWPIQERWAWRIAPYNQSGTRWRFSNSKYDHYWTADFVFTKTSHR